jgi:replicative DNA helicase
MLDMAPDATPHDLDLEQAMLATILADNAALDRVPRLEPAHFHSDVHKGVFAAARKLRHDKQRVSLVTLRGLIGASDPLGGKSILEVLKEYSFGDHKQDATELADALMRFARKRRLQDICTRAAGSVWDLQRPEGEAIADTMRDLDGLLAETRTVQRTEWDAVEGVDDMLKSIEADNRANRIPTGWGSLDAKLGGGLRRGRYNILAGRTSMGKTMCAVCMGTNAAKAGHGVLVLSMEMSKDEWLARMASEETNLPGSPVPYVDALAGRLDQAAHERFVRAALSLRKLPLRVEERSRLSMGEIVMHVRRAAEAFERQGTRLGLVIVDHLGKVRPSDRYKGNTVRELGEVSEGIHHLAKSEDVAVLALHQLNRAVETRENRRPGLADLRDSGNVEQDADVVMFAFRAAYYLAKKEDEPAKELARQAALAAAEHKLEISVAKNRNGSCGGIDLWCDVSTNHIRAIANGGAA